MKREAKDNGRVVAVRVLSTVFSGNRFASDLLDEEFRKRCLEPRERRLATELVYGCVRRKGTLDWVIERGARRSMDKISRRLRDILRVGLYQMLFLERVPRYAAVNEAVELAKRYGPRGAEKFVNAVMRNAPRSLEEIQFPGDVSPFRRFAIRYSFPEWLVRRWIERRGEEEAERICSVQSSQAPLTVRVNRLRCTRGELLARLAEEGVEARADAGHALAVAVDKLPCSIGSLPAFRDGWFQVQDVSGMLVLDVCGARAGEKVADLCSAPGGKATGLAECMGNEGELHCLDISGEKTAKVRENAERLGCSIVDVRRGDSLRASRYVEAGTMDRVLVDAPCSNTGVLRRRPEVRWRLREADIARLARRQLKLLNAASGIVRPGGSLIYSTCSIEPEENAKLVETFLGNRKGFHLEFGREMIPREGGHDGGYVARMVWRH
jgi:16S rRNA (cytosine967-C5)-methyltransferase